jgi:hypothetical protein
VDNHKPQLLAPILRKAGGGGGGHAPLPASQGGLPKLDRRQFIPPSVTPAEFNAALLMEATLVSPAELPDPVLTRIGDPLGTDGPPSNGPGGNGGIGGGNGGEIGDRNGLAHGADEGGGVELARIVERGGIAPRVLYKVDPEFSDAARKAKYQGTLLLTIEIGEDGKTRAFHVLRGLGLGLDEKSCRSRLALEIRTGNARRPACTHSGHHRSTLPAPVNWIRSPYFDIDHV